MADSEDWLSLSDDEEATTGAAESEDVVYQLNDQPLVEVADVATTNTLSLEAVRIAESPPAEPSPADSAVPVVDNLIPTVDTNQPEAQLEIAEEILQPVQISSSQNLAPSEPPIYSTDTPRALKKRKHTQSTPVHDESGDRTLQDDGCLCPICFDSWEISGPHRLTSLKCGHLFGHSCIKRWLQGSSASTRCCPSCKSKAAMRDLRFLFAKRLTVLDNSERDQLATDLESSRALCKSLSAELDTVRIQSEMTSTIYKRLVAEHTELKRRLVCGEESLVPLQGYQPYRVHMERNIELTKEPGCRVLLAQRLSKQLVASQKSTQTLFPGYGIRLIDMTTLRPNQFVHLSSKLVRDLAFNDDESLLAAATLEPGCFKLYAPNGVRSIQLGLCDTTAAWSCAFDAINPHKLYLGLQSGVVAVHDLRTPNQLLKTINDTSDFSPVIQVISVRWTIEFPVAGVIVCQLRSLLFYETESQKLARLNVTGSFISCSYDSITRRLLVSTRPSNDCPHARHIVGRLVRIGNTTAFEEVNTYRGSAVQATMSRTALVSVEQNLLVAAYHEDVHALHLWGQQSATKLQTLPISENAFDICPVYLPDKTYLAMLTGSKCKIFKVEEMKG